MNKGLFSSFSVKMKFNQAYKLDELREAQVIQIATQAGVITIEEARERLGMDPQIPEGTMPNAVGDDSAINFDADARAERGQEEPEKDDTDNKLKSVIKSLPFDANVSFDNFVSIVEDQIGEGGFDKAKILYYETSDAFVMFFDDNSWKYKSIVLKSTLDDLELFRLKLQFAIKIKP